MEKGRSWVNKKLRDFSQKDSKGEHYVSVEMLHVQEEGVVTQHTVTKQRTQRRTNQDAELLWLNKPYDENYDEYLYALNKDLSGTINDRKPEFQALLSQIRAGGFTLHRVTGATHASQVELMGRLARGPEMTGGAETSGASSDDDTYDDWDDYAMVDRRAAPPPPPPPPTHAQNNNKPDESIYDIASEAPSADGSKPTPGGTDPEMTDSIPSPKKKSLFPPDAPTIKVSQPTAVDSNRQRESPTPNRHRPPPPPPSPSTRGRVPTPSTPPTPPVPLPPAARPVLKNRVPRPPVPVIARGIHAPVQNSGKDVMRQLLRANSREFRNAFFRSVRGDIGNVVSMMCQILKEDFPGENKLVQDEFLDKETGMTLLQAAVMFNCKNTLKWLIDYGGEELIVKPRVVKQNYNQSALHIAVSNSDKEAILLLLKSITSYKKCKEFVNQCTTIKRLKSSMDYTDSSLPAVVSVKHNQSLRLERCLEIAVWEKRLELIPILVENGAEPLSRDPSGNTLLHSLVAQAAARVMDKEYYKKAFETVVDAIALWNARRNNRTTPKDMDRLGGLKDAINIVNNDNLSPLSLAVKLESHIFENLINLENILKFSQITLGSVTSSNFDITGINSYCKESDDAKASYAYNIDSCLHIAAHTPVNLRKHRDAIDIVDTEPISTLIMMKWKFYRWFFFAWFLIHTTYMVIFSVFAFQVDPLEPEIANRNPAIDSNVSGGNLSDPLFKAFSQQSDRSLWYLWFVSLPGFYVIFEMIDICKPTRKMTLMRRFKEANLTGNSIYRIGYLTFSLSIGAWLLCYYTKSVNHDISVATAMLLGWLFLLFFTRPIRRVGVFSIMMQRMLYKDVFPFIIISTVMLLSFSLAMHAMILNHPDVMGKESFGSTFYAMFKVIIDLDDKQTYAHSRNPTFAKLLLSVYGLILVILLVNMLIATMNTSYDIVRTTKCNLILRQQASLLLLLERRLPRCIVQMSERRIIRKGGASEKQYLYVSAEAFQY